MDASPIQREPQDRRVGLTWGVVKPDSAFVWATGGFPATHSQSPGSLLRLGSTWPCLAGERFRLHRSRAAQPSAAAAAGIQWWRQLCDKGGDCALLRWVIMLGACSMEMQGLSDKARSCSCCQGSSRAERRGQGLEVTLPLGEPVVDNELLIPRGTHPTGHPRPSPGQGKESKRGLSKRTLSK